MGKGECQYHLRERVGRIGSEGVQRYLKGVFMSSSNSRSFFRFLLMVATTVALCAQFGMRSEATVQKPKSETRSTSRWEWSDDGWKRRVEVYGKAEFKDDYSDVSSLSADGLVTLEEVHNRESRRLEVRRDPGGQLVRRYFLNGELRPLDENGRKWIAELLLTAVRQGAFDVENRVKTIMAQRGVGGVIDEIALIKGDYAKRIYFEAVLKNPNLNRADIPKVIEAIGNQLSSDYEKAGIAKNTSDVFLADSKLTTVFFRAVATIKSDYEHRGVLSSILKRSNLSEHVLSEMLQSATAISSDYEKATFLLEAANLYAADARLRSAFLKTVDTIKSDHERGRVLSALLKKGQIS